MDRDSSAARMTHGIAGPLPVGSRPVGRSAIIAATAAAVLLLAGCAHVGRLQNMGHTVSPVLADSTEPEEEERARERTPLRPLFGDTLIGLMPGTADSTRRFLGRLRDGYTADTLNIILCGDNRPGYRVSRLNPEILRIRQGLSLNPIKFLRGLINIPWAIAKGLYPDLALIRELPALIRHMPKWSREHQVINAVMVKVDSLHAHGQNVAAVINTGDLVYNGQYPAHWERFLRITQPLTSRVPYFPIAGNHERTDTVDGVENWRIATGLPVGGDRLYYCFDSADGWVRFIALDSNPFVDPRGRWTREVGIKYSEEEFAWLVDRVKEHNGPVMVLMHNPPFSVSAHRMEWQRDAVLIERRERMVKALHEAGIAILASGHEHSYQRALLTWPDAVLVVIISAGGGAPLHPIPPPAESARLFSEYKVAGSVVKPENVFTSQVFNFTHLRLWFGGGDLYTYAVDRKSNATLIDKVQVDLGRYGIPKIDQHKLIVPPSTGPAETMKPAASVPTAPAATAVDSTSASKRLLSKPPPSAPQKRKRISAAKRDSVSVDARRPSTPPPAKGRP
jgi:predicted MPP superfamily phosphohydrolase